MKTLSYTKHKIKKQTGFDSGLKKLGVHQLNALPKQKVKKSA